MKIGVQQSILNVSLIICLGVHQCQAQYILDVIRTNSLDENEIVHKCAATGGNFGKDVTDFIISVENLACTVPVDPIDACGPIKAPHNVTRECENVFAMVSRSSPSHPCKFSHQSFMVQNSSYHFKLVLFYNYPGEDPISMEGSDMRDKIYLPVLMISNTCKEEIIQRFSDFKRYRLRVRIDPGYYELFRYLIPFLVVIVFCFALFLITLCVRGCVEQRKMNRRRLSKRNLKKIPVKKYRLGDDPDTCAICLESFSPGEKLRHLPCRHVFHCKCIDVWLTQTRKVCPLCKRKIGSDSDSDCSTNELAESSQRLNDGNTLLASDGNALNRRELTVNPENSQFVDFWSSQEALVDRDIVLTRTARQSMIGFMRNTISQLRGNRREGTEEGTVDLERNAFAPSDQQSQVNDREILLENEIASSYNEASPEGVAENTITEESTITLSGSVLQNREEMS